MTQGYPEVLGRRRFTFWENRGVIESTRAVAGWVSSFHLRINRRARGTHDIHALILGRAITGIAAFN